MKKLSTLLSVFSLFQILAQINCEGGRYANDVFENVTVTPNQVYGQNTSWTGSNTTLYFDFYEPQGDNLAARPLIIWVHGGSFLGGSRTEADMVALSTRFAKKGFACASISYRTGFFPIDSTNSVRAVVRAVQDLKGAIRYFYKDAATDNSYKIDTTNIFIGGSSAGAITALHVAYLNEECELYDYLSASQQASLGGLEGNSGNPGYATKVKGVLNGAGALARYSWMDASEINIPIASVHGTSDNVVKYNRGMVNPGVPLMYLDGSRMLHERACALNMDNQLYTFVGAGHVPYLGSSAAATAYMDTTVNFYRDFLVRQLGCDAEILQPENAWSENATLYNAQYCNGSPVNAVCAATANINQNNLLIANIFPNPTTDVLNITFSDHNLKSISLFDINGRQVYFSETTLTEVSLGTKDLNSGCYIVRIGEHQSGRTLVEKLIKE